MLRELGELTLQHVRSLLDSQLRQRSSGRPWWEAMRDEENA